jgi:hypothetical protein
MNPLFKELHELIQTYLQHKKNEDTLPFRFWNEFSEAINTLKGGYEMDSIRCRKMMQRRYKKYKNKLTVDVVLKHLGIDVDIVANFQQKLEEPTNQTIYELSSDKYFFDETNGNYIIPLKSAPKPLIISSTNLKLIKRRYSNWDGIPSSINEICRDFSIPRSWFNELKNIMGWTHDSEPYLESEILSEDGDKLIDETLQEIRRNLYQKFEKRKWDDLKQDAEKYRSMEQTIIIPLREKITEHMPKYNRLNINLGGSSKTQPYALVFAPMDIHVGKLPYINNGYDPDKFDYEVTSTIEGLFKTVSIYGKPERLITVSGSDMFHIDSANITTTKGTTQAGQNLGSHHDVIVRGYKLGFQIWDFLMDFSEGKTQIHNLHVAGNHDKSTSLQFAVSLEQRYRNCKNFTSDYSIFERKFDTYGDNLIIATHGEFMKTNNTTRNHDIMSSILVDSKKQRIDISKTQNFIHFSGHFHKTALSTHNESTGIIDITVPSLAVSDLWHHQMGYEGNNRRVSCYRIDKEQGLVGIDMQIVI